MLRFLTAGESHGKSLSVIVEGLPASLPLSEGLHRASHGAPAGWLRARAGRMQIEKDRAEILAGVRHGLTLGSPISLNIINRDFSTGKGPDGVPWIEEMSVAPSDVPFEPIVNIRPGHADAPGIVKYMQADARNILERSSARESASRVAAGALAQRFLESSELRCTVTSCASRRARQQTGDSGLGGTRGDALPPGESRRIQVRRGALRRPRGF